MNGWPIEDDGPVRSTEHARPGAPGRGGSGRLVLGARPEAGVWLDGRRLGATPVDVELPAGPHTLALRSAEDGIARLLEVRIVEGRTIEHRVLLWDA